MKFEKDKTKILNALFGSKNVLLHQADGNSIHVGDKNIYYDLEHEKLKTICPNCGESAGEEPTEEKEMYKSFICSNCDTTYYEYDKVANNISEYLDLDFEKGREFSRLISAVNHDLKVGFFEKAFDRCLRHKETYGKTPQIYEWGALTLFLQSDIDYLIKTSCREVIIYLDKSREIDLNSLTYDGIASSIGTRYFQLIFNKIEKAKRSLYTVTEEEIQQIGDSDNFADIKRKEIFKYLLELKTCYRINPDPDYVIAGIEELYGYNSFAWFDLQLKSLFKAPKTIPRGYRRALKGYVWDFHIISSNSDDLFVKKKHSPTSLAIYFEHVLLSSSKTYTLSEVRVGGRYDFPISTNGRLRRIQVIFYIILIILSIILIVIESYVLLFLFTVLFSFLYYKKIKGDKINIDDYRRIIDLDKEQNIRLLPAKKENLETIDLDLIHKKVTVKKRQE